MFQQFDKDGNGTISFDEFIVALRVSAVCCFRLVDMHTCCIATPVCMCLCVAPNESVKERDH